MPEAGDIECSTRSRHCVSASEVVWLYAELGRQINNGGVDASEARMGRM